MGPSKFFSSAIVSNFSVAYRVVYALIMAMAEMPVPALVLVLEPIGAQPVDDAEHFGQVAVLVPGLQTLMNERPEVEIAIALHRNELLEVAPLHSLPAVSEQRPHRIGGDHWRAAIACLRGARGFGRHASLTNAFREPVHELIDPLGGPAPLRRDLGDRHFGQLRREGPQVSGSEATTRCTSALKTRSAVGLSDAGFEIRVDNLAVPVTVGIGLVISRAEGLATDALGLRVARTAEWFSDHAAYESPPIATIRIEPGRTLQAVEGHLLPQVLPVVP